MNVIYQKILYIVCIGYAIEKIIKYECKEILANYNVSQFYFTFIRFLVKCK